MIYHAIERTSPKGPGSKFIGTCRLCGTPNLPADAALLECPNQRGLTADEALIETIDSDWVQREHDKAVGREAIVKLLGIKHSSR